MSKLLKNLKKRITLFAAVMLALQPVLGLAMLPAKTFAATSDVVINEVQTGGTSASDEFVELYNKGAASVDVGGWQVQYSAAADGTTFTTKATIPGTTTILAGGYYLLGNGNIGNVVDQSMTSGLAAAGGHVRIAKADGTEMDRVGYGTATQPETTAAIAPAAGESIERTGGIDTGDNSADFTTNATPTPTSSDATAPVVTVNTLVTNNQSPVVTGTIDDNTATTINVNVNGVDYVGTNNLNNTWSATVTATLLDATYEVLVTATDPNGNPGTDASTLELTIDTAKPVIALIGDDPQTVELGSPYVELGATVTDDNPGIPAYTSDGATVVDTTTLGSYIVTYDAVDAAGNNAVQVVRTVNVVSPVSAPPVVGLPAPPVVTTAAVETPVENQTFGAESYQGEVKADTVIETDEGNTEESNGDEEQTEETKGERNVPLWGIIFLLILAGIGGYLFYSQGPDKTSGQ